MYRVMQFPVVIHKDPTSVFGVTIPDIPGCHSCGDTMDEAIANIKDAAESHLEILIENGSPIDFEASDINEIKHLDVAVNAEIRMAEIEVPC